MSEAAEGRGNQAYLRFWKNAIRWLMKDTTVARVTVDTPRENYAMGDEVRVITRVRDPGFAPMEGATITADVLPLGWPVEVSRVVSRTGRPTNWDTTRSKTWSASMICTPRCCVC